MGDASQDIADELLAGLCLQTHVVVGNLIWHNSIQKIE
jgi:hypothetical protein